MRVHALTQGTVYLHVHIINDEIPQTKWLTLKTGLVQSLRLVSISTQTESIETFLFYKNSAPHGSADLGLVSKSTGMSQIWDSSPWSPPTPTTLEHWALFCSFQLTIFTALNQTHPAVCFWYFLLHGWHHDMDELRVCSMINAVRIKTWWSKERWLSLFSWMSRPPAPWFGNHQFLQGSSYWRCSRGCCDPSTNSHPPTDQSDHWRKKRHRGGGRKRVKNILFLKNKEKRLYSEKRIET